MKPTRLIALLACLVALSGCSSAPPKIMPPAVLVQASSEMTEVLDRAVGHALNGRKVSLASNTFTRSSEVKIERVGVNPSTMPGLNGRMMGIPEAYHFSLRKRAGTCHLVYEETGQIYPLDGIKCKRLRR